MDHKHIFKLVSIAATLVLSSPSFSQLASAERRGLEDGLYLANLTTADFSFARRAVQGSNLLPISALLESNPIAGVDKVISLHETTGTELAQFLRLVQSDILGKTERRPGDFSLSEIQVDPATPEAFKEVVFALAKGVAKSSASVRTALSKLSSDERRDLIESLPQIATRDSKTKFDFVERKSLPEAECQKILEKVDWQRMSQAATELLEAYDDNIARLIATAKSSPFIGDYKLSFGKMKIVLAGEGPNFHSDRDAVITIDIGGSDRYSGRHGAGIGYSALHIDLSGDDTYELPDASLGAGLLGCGMSSDLGGDDVIRSRSIAIGSGLGGFGLFRKSGGHDFYQTATLSCGFGMFGAGIFLDSAGSDVYQCQSTSQGSANAHGVGWQIDLNGNDTYRAASNGYRGPTLCQGASSGFVDGRVGGCGLLTDRDGIDSYISVSHSQAAGRLGGIGSLSDAKGNDTYVSFERSQAWSESNGMSVLIESLGDDGYLATRGLSHAQSQDFSFSFLIERSGDDLYAGQSSRPGTAHSGSAAIFYDLAGDDRYAGSPGLGIPTAQTHSLGAFIDLIGEDVYFEGLDNGEAHVTEGTGLAFDQASMRPSNSRSPTHDLPKPGSIPSPGAQELRELIRSALHADSDKARLDTISKLVGIGMPAFEVLLNEYLENATLSERALILDTAIGIGAEARNLLSFQITKENDNLALNALLICESGRFKEAGAVMIGALRRPILRQVAARAAGDFGEKASASELMIVAADKDLMTSAYALMSLAILADPASITTGQALLSSPDFMVRSAARKLVSQFPEAAINIARGLTRDQNERLARIGLELLGSVGTPEAMKVASESLSDVRSGVRIAALNALNGRCPEDKRPLLMSLKRDPDHRVRAIAARIDPGRGSPR